MKALLQQLCHAEVIQNAIKVSMVVGTLLNLINQWDVISGEQSWRWGMALLNYVVPFSVASYSAAKQRLSDNMKHKSFSDNSSNRNIPHDSD